MYIYNYSIPEKRTFHVPIFQKKQFYGLGLAISFGEAKPELKLLGIKQPFSASYLGLEGVFGGSEKHLDPKKMTGRYDRPTRYL